MPEVTVEQLKQMQDRVEKARQDKYRAEAQMETLAQQEQEYLQQCRDLGVEPDAIDGEIARIGEEIASAMALFDQLLPEERLAATAP